MILQPEVNGDCDRWPLSNNLAMGDLGERSIVVGVTPWSDSDCCSWRVREKDSEPLAASDASSDPSCAALGSDTWTKDTGENVTI